MRVRRGRSPGRLSDPSHYKPHLRTPFRFRCAYCQTHDSRLGGLEGMTVDHFHPVVRFPDLRLAWTNLYYACVVCNSRYKRDRPTEEEKKAGHQFVDVCRMDPDEHFHLEWSAPECKFIATSSTQRGLFTLRILHFNDRPFLRDWWLELDDGKAKAERQLAQIRDSLRIAQRIVRSAKGGEARELQRQLTELERDCLARLESTHEQWPFPVAVARPRN